MNGQSLLMQKKPYLAACEVQRFSFLYMILHVHVHSYSNWIKESIQVINYFDMSLQPI